MEKLTVYIHDKFGNTNKVEQDGTFKELYGIRDGGEDFKEIHLTEVGAIGCDVCKNVIGD